MLQERTVFLSRGREKVIEKKLMLLNGALIYDLKLHLFLNFLLSVFSLSFLLKR